MAIDVSDIANEPQATLAPDAPAPTSAVASASWWHDPELRMRRSCYAFACVCLLVLVLDWYLERKLPEPALQPATTSDELQALHNQMVSGKVVVAKRGLQKYVNEHPNEAQAYSLLASTQVAVGAHGQAIDTLRYAIALDPNKIDYRMFLGELYFNIGWYSKSEQQYTTVLALQPDSLDALSARIELNYVLGRVDLMLQDAEFAVVAHPQSPQAHYLRGRSLVLNGQDRASLESLQFVIAADEPNLRAEAQRILDQLLAKQPQQPQQPRQ